MKGNSKKTFYINKKLIYYKILYIYKEKEITLKKILNSYPQLKVFKFKNVPRGTFLNKT